MSRQVVKTEWAEIEIPEIEFEVKKQVGLITTIEGIIDRAIEGLKETQQSLIVSRKLIFIANFLSTQGQDPKSCEKLSEFLIKLIELKQGDKNFTFVCRSIFKCKI